MLKSIQKIKRKIAYFTGTRADFGLMTSILEALDKSEHFSLQIFATGTHLMPRFGKTIAEVQKLFPTTKQLPATLKGDNSTSVANFISHLLPQVIRGLHVYEPDIVLTLGDRPEMLCVAIACWYLGIPTAHIHGGDKSMTVDDSSRHAITKLSHLHFPATKESARRITKLGEETWRIHTIGAPALDQILHASLPNRVQLCRNLGLDPGKKFILLTQHPVSEALNQARKQIRETIAAIKKFGLPIVAIYPHPDPGGRKIIAEIDKEKKNNLWRIFPTIDHANFLALEREAAVWVGNSSAAMIESASFHTPVVMVGLRQQGRLCGKNVISVYYDRRKIIFAITKSLNDITYLKKLARIENPWGDGHAAEHLTRILKHVPIDNRLLHKQITY